MCKRIYFVELKHSQLKINHLNDTPSTKAVGGGIYSDVFIKDVKATKRSSWVPFLPTEISNPVSAVDYLNTGRYLDWICGYLT